MPSKKEEASANCAKARKEMEILEIQKRITLLRERKQLLDEHVCTEEELDKYLRPGE